MTGDTTVQAERVTEAIRTVDDPDLGVDVLEAGLVTDVAVDGGEVTVTMDLDGVNPPVAETVVESVRSVVLETPGVDGVSVDGDQPQSGDTPDDATASEETVIVVASAKGGVGKTTVATHLAASLARECRVGVFDADIYGPNVPDVLDADGPVRANDDGDPVPVERSGIELMSVGFLSDDGPLAWRGSMAHDALTELFQDTAWTDREVLVVDLPPGTGDIALTVLQNLPVDGAVFVTTPYPTSVADTNRSVRLFEENGVPVVGAVVNMAGFTCEECGHEHDLFPAGEFDSALDAPVLAELPFTSSVQGTASGTDAPAAFDAVTDAVSAHVESVDDVTVPETALDVRTFPPSLRPDQVQEEFAVVEPGEEFALVTDRDPAPLASLLAGDDEPGDRFEQYDRRRLAADKWVLTIVR